MIKRIIPIALVGISMFSILACNSKKDGFQTKDGLEYKIVKDVPGDKKAAVGDFMKLHIHMLVDTNTGNTHGPLEVIADSRKLNNNEPLDMQLMAPQFKGDWTSGLTMLTAGDSAVFRVSADTIKKALGNLPPYLKPGQTVEFDIAVVSIKSKEDYKKEMDEKATKQKDIDDKLLQDYFTKNNIKPTKTASGLYYVIEKEGTGPSPKMGQKVSVNYTGTLLNGEKFDSNIDTSFHHAGKPAEFEIGNVIEGWNEGLQLMKKGGKATFYIPSGLAYGPQARSEKIGPNSILVFQVELLDFK
jgi:FKBP-type peptidyl-prolyl cis-trans isomerase